MARPIAKDHDLKRQNILQTAARVFARDGIARASMNEVAKACGVSKATLYHYHSSKDDLVFDILDTYLSGLRDWVCELDLTGKSPEAQLHRVIEAFLLAYEGMDAEHKIQTEGLPLLGPDQQNVLKGYQRALVDHVSNTLALCAPDAMTDLRHRRDVAMSIFGMLNWFYMWQPKATRADRIAYARVVTDLTLNGITRAA